jgi:hypothetical protein
VGDELGQPIYVQALAVKDEYILLHGGRWLSAVVERNAALVAGILRATR